MKTIFNTALAMLACCCVSAQTHFAVFKSNKSNPLPKVIEAVLHDFPNNFKNISGELLFKQGEIENYSSLVQPPGAEDCMITRYHSIEDTSSSWQAKMFRSEDFSKASGEYKNLYRQLKGCYLRLVDGSIVYLNGEWEAAREESAFTTSTLRLATGDDRYREVKIELELLYLFPEWMININVVNKRKDTLEY